ncbi:hypothetical protein TSMEX_001349, partial [Taenia solium]
SSYLEAGYLDSGWREPSSPGVPHCTCACGLGVHAKRGVDMEIMPGAVVSRSPKEGCIGSGGNPAAKSSHVVQWWDRACEWWVQDGPEDVR